MTTINQTIDCPMNPKHRQILDLLKELAEELGYEHLEWSLGSTHHGNEAECLEAWDYFPARLYGERKGSTTRGKISITELLEKAQEKSIQDYRNEHNDSQNQEEGGLFSPNRTEDSPINLGNRG